MVKTIQSPDYRVLLELLKAQRHKAGLRQVDLAEQLGVAQSYVSKIESGERRVDVLELRAICQVMGISLSSFIRQLEAALARGTSTP